MIIKLTKNEVIEECKMRNRFYNLVVDKLGKPIHDPFVVDYDLLEGFLYEGRLDGVDFADYAGEDTFYVFEALPDTVDVDPYRITLIHDDIGMPESVVGGQDILCSTIVNPENEQRLIERFVSRGYAQLSWVERDLDMTAYPELGYEWTSERAKIIEQAMDDQLLSEAYDRWDRLLKRYADGVNCTDHVDWGGLRDQILDKSSNRNAGINDVVIVAGRIDGAVKVAVSPAPEPEAAKEINRITRGMEVGWIWITSHSDTRLELINRTYDRCKNAGLTVGYEDIERAMDKAGF